MRTSSARTAGLGTTIFAEMSGLAARHGAVNLGQGFPDSDGPAELLERARAAIANGANQYAPGRGIAPLRRAIAEHRLRHHGVELDLDRQVAVTTGATEAIAAAVLGLVDPGDEVLVLEPYYDSYVAVIGFAGARRVPLLLKAPDFRLDVEALRAAVTPSTRAILLNTPHNPTGTVLDATELEAIADVARRHDLVVISDEVYEHLTFDGTAHVPISTLPGMAERTVTISSAGKTFSVTGWKVGWVTGPAALVDAVVAVQQFLTYTSGTPFQEAVAWALEHADDEIEVLRRRLQARRDQLCEGLERLGFDVVVPAGTYFASTDVRSLGFDDGLTFCRELPARVGVAAVPHQVFHDDVDAGRPWVRWAFCKSEATVAEALRRLATLRS